MHALDYYYERLGRHILEPHQLDKVSEPCLYCGRGHPDIDVFETDKTVSKKSKHAKSPKCNACYSMTAKHALPKGTKGALMPTHGVSITAAKTVFYSNIPVLTGADIETIDPKKTDIDVKRELFNRAMSLTAADLPALFIMFDADPARVISDTLQLTTSIEVIHLCGQPAFAMTIRKAFVEKYQALLNESDITFKELSEAAQLYFEHIGRIGNQEKIQEKLIRIYNNKPALKDLIPQFPIYKSSDYELLRKINPV